MGEWIEPRVKLLTPDRPPLFACNRFEVTCSDGLRSGNRIDGNNFSNADVGERVDRQRIANAAVDLRNSLPHHRHTDTRDGETRQDGVDDVSA